MENTNNPIIITRTFNAPLEKIWNAWVDPEEMKKWWGPEGFTCPVAKIDFREGGTYLLDMRGGESMGKFAGKDMWSTGTYKEIMPMQKIVVTDSFADEAGNIVPSSHYGMEGMPLATEITMEFLDNGNNTATMKITHNGIPEAMQKECEEGWMSSFNKLAETLK